MKIQRTKNAKRNIVFGTFNRLTGLVFPFIIRTVMLYYMGVEWLWYNGNQHGKANRSLDDAGRRQGGEVRHDNREEPFSP
jgi:hypothetical protein